jgi:hypothetical protein
VTVSLRSASTVRRDEQHVRTSPDRCETPHCARLCTELAEPLGILFRGSYDRVSLCESASAAARKNRHLVACVAGSNRFRELPGSGPSRGRLPLPRRLPHLRFKRAFDRHRLGRREILALEVLVRLSARQFGNVDHAGCDLRPPKVLGRREAPFPGDQRALGSHHHRMKQADVRYALREAGDITHFSAVAGTDNDIVNFHASLVIITSRRG